MNRPLCVLFAAAAGCGVASTPATPEVKATAATALSSMQAATVAFTAAENLISAGSSAVESAHASGLPVPSGSAYAIDPSGLGLLYELIASPSPWFSGAVGCLQNGGNVPTPPDGTTCTADDHLEVDFANGDVAHFADDAATSSDKVWITAGPWSGTSFVLTAPGSAPAHLVGTFKLQSSAGSIDIDVDWTYASSNYATQQFTLSATDHLANVQMQAQWSLAMAGDGRTATGHETFTAQAGQVPHTVECDFQLHGGMTRDPNSGLITALTAQASGAVLWDQRQAGSISSVSGSSISARVFVIAWNDGTSVPFGPPTFASWP
jgi:hypothetical protein